MGVQYTKDQEKVIKTRNRNVLVSAAAGSGKTAVLVERIIRMICDTSNPVDIDKLLIVTFTKAAAAEMRERISQAITKALEDNPGNEHLEKQGTLLHNALITTIDSLCTYLLRNHFHEIDLDPAFRTADEGEMKLLREDVMKEMMEDYFASKNEAFEACVEYFCPGGREKVLEDYIMDLCKYAESHPWPEEWLAARKNDYVVESLEELENSPVGQSLLKYTKGMMEGCVNLLTQAQRIVHEPDGPYMYGELVDRELERAEKALSCETLAQWEIQLSGMDFDRLPSKTDETVSPEKREAANNLRTAAKKIVQSIQKDFFTTPLCLTLSQMAECVGPCRMLIELAEDYRRRVWAAKVEKKILDFSDIEHLAVQILVKRDGDTLKPTPVAKAYREHFHEVLIDEYQDSNLVQEFLLSALSGEADGRFNRFMVGDVKQSIYKFRLARPELFVEKYKEYSPEENEKQRIDLSMNFRSRDTVIDTVNNIFSRIMSEDKGGIEYDRNAALYLGAKYPPNPDTDSELILVEKSSKGDELSSKQREALAIAKRIKELKENFRVTIKGTEEQRPLEYRDIVILLRSGNNWDEEFRGVLEAEGIPVYITSKTGYFAATEVKEILQLFRVLDNPRQDIPLFGTLKSIFGGFTDEEIALVRSKDKKSCLWENLCKAASEDGKEWEIPMELSRKCMSFVEFIEKYRVAATYMPIGEMLQKIVDEFNYMNYVTALPGGSKRRANVEMLFTKAASFEASSFFGLFHFVRYIEHLEKNDIDYGEAELLDESADVVRIMTIHKSKGLEFPVVFVSGLSKRMNMQDVSKAFLMDVDMGLGIDYVNADKRIKNKTLRRLLIGKKLKEDTLGEELRVLYVALTRAREKLIMTASVSKAASLEEQIEARLEGEIPELSYTEYMQAGSLFDFIYPVVTPEFVTVSVFDKEEEAEEDFEEQVKLSGRKDELEASFSRVNEESLEKLRERFEAGYAYENLASLYTKTSVSELKIAAMEEKDEVAFQLFEEKDPDIYVPAFALEMAKKTENESETQEADEQRGSGKRDVVAGQSGVGSQITGTMRGNAYHKVMELMDFEAVYEGISSTMSEDMKNTCMKQNLVSFLDSQVACGKLKKEYRDIVSVKKLIHFLQCDLAKRMRTAEAGGRLYREQPFVYGIKANRLNKDFPDTETVLIQGIIDAFFVEDGKVVLLDYKTDRVENGAELWNRYSTQVEYYQEALEKLMNMPVGDKVLYSFSLEEEVRG